LSKDYSNHQTESVPLPSIGGGSNAHYRGPTQAPAPVTPTPPVENDHYRGPTQSPPPKDGTSAGPISSGTPQDL
jgi:hypothetical protein